ncbi:hypothetical protein JTB14_038398 [Gonioctena quinquepunctata]|nr:hypothetical protein JTB14_038398 [Gonioctena quinquepunctata]
MEKPSFPKGNPGKIETFSVGEKSRRSRCSKFVKTYMYESGSSDPPEDMLRQLKANFPEVTPGSIKTKKTKTLYSGIQGFFVCVFYCRPTKKMGDSDMGGNDIKATVIDLDLDEFLGLTTFSKSVLSPTH